MGLNVGHGGCGIRSCWRIILTKKFDDSFSNEFLRETCSSYSTESIYSSLVGVGRCVYFYRDLSNVLN